MQACGNEIGRLHGDFQASLHNSGNGALKTSSYLLGKAMFLGILDRMDFVWVGGGVGGAASSPLKP